MQPVGTNAGPLVRPHRLAGVSPRGHPHVAAMTGWGLRRRNTTRYTKDWPHRAIPQIFTHSSSTFMTAKALSLIVPPPVLVAADEVID